MELKDPVKDRNFFIERLQRTFMKDHTTRYINALMDSDLIVQANCKKEREKNKLQVKHYLDLYDSAKTEEEKRAVVGSVRADYQPS